MAQDGVMPDHVQLFVGGSRPVLSPRSPTTSKGATSRHGARSGTVGSNAWAWPALDRRFTCRMDPQNSISSRSRPNRKPRASGGSAVLTTDIMEAEATTRVFQRIKSERHSRSSSMPCWGTLMCYTLLTVRYVWGEPWDGGGGLAYWFLARLSY